MVGDGVAVVMRVGVGQGWVWGCKPHDSLNRLWGHGGGVADGT